MMRLLTGSITLGHVFGIPLKVGYLLIVFVLFLGLQYIPRGQGWYGLLFFVFYVLALYGSVALHELGHAYGTRLVGGLSGEIQLTPLGGIHFGTGSDQSPRTELLVVALGPLVNVILAGLAYAGLHLFRNAGSIPSLIALSALAMVWQINVTMAVFNLMCPIYPLDCARLLRAAFSLWYPAGRVTYYVCMGGLGLCILMILAWVGDMSVPVIGNIGVWAALIAILGGQVCYQTLQHLPYGLVYSRGDSWGGTQVYHDQEVMQGAWRMFLQDLRLSPSTRRQPRGTVPRKPARVIEVPFDPEKSSDIPALKERLREAVQREDFVLAARIQKRLKDMGAGGG